MRIVTVEPLGNSVPAAGDWLITRFSGATSPTWTLTLKPNFCNSAIAFLRGMSTKFGTVTGGGPLEITRSTLVPEFTVVPALGFIDMTVFFGTTSEKTLLRLINRPRSLS
jgi:hypothetical protein